MSSPRLHPGVLGRLHPPEPSIFLPASAGASCISQGRGGSSPLTIRLIVGHQEKCGDSMWEQLTHFAVRALKAESKMSFFRAKT